MRIKTVARAAIRIDPTLALRVAAAAWRALDVTLQAMCHVYVTLQHRCNCNAIASNLTVLKVFNRGKVTSFKIELCADARILNHSD